MKFIPISKFKGYFATKNGEIWSAWIQGFNCNHKRIITKKLHKLFGNISVQGYLAISLKEGNNRFVGRLHRIIAQTFLPNPDNKPYVCHKDGNKLNNKVKNLYWGTAKENQADSIKHGTRMMGFKSPNTKINLFQIARIKLMLELKTSQKKIASIFNVTQSTISRIKLNKTYLAKIAF